jgi:hypothetical protein
MLVFIEISRPSFLLADNLDDLYVIGIEWAFDVEQNREALSFPGLSDECRAELEQVQRQLELQKKAMDETLTWLNKPRKR